MIENRKISALSRLGRSLVFTLFVVSFLGVVEIGAAQSLPSQPTTKVRTAVGGASAAAGSLNSSVVPSNPILTTSNIVGGGSSTTSAMPRMRGTTNKQRMAAAAHGAIARAKSRTVAARSMGLGAKGNAIVGIPGAGSGVWPDEGAFYFSGLYPNYANSPLPNPNDTVNCSAPNYCGIRKFVDQLSTPGGALTPTLGQTMPVAVPDTTTFPGSDYYEIALVQYSEKLHSDLPPTMLRGYVQTNIIPAMQPHYLGPLIIATTNRPVRVKFTNKLGSVKDPNFATTGMLFVPEDNTVLGAGLGLAKVAAPYLDNRATIHMHGGNTPWISDGTPHQWTVPAVDAATTYPRGDSVQFVPDMWFDAGGNVLVQCTTPIQAGLTTCANPDNSNMAALKVKGYSNEPGPGTLTFYYTNQQSARLMFYHDHSYGTTRLNVYIGEAGGYLIQDQAELDLINGTNVSGIFATTPPKSIPAIEVPLIIQDKTFVPPNFAAGTTIYSVNLLQGGQGYTTATVGFTGGCTVAPTATANVGLSIDPFGQFIYGAITGITINTYGSGCTADPLVSITGDGNGAAAFASIATLSQQDPTWDTALWGGQGNLWYPHVYMPNQWPNNPDGSGANPMGRWDYAAWFWPAFTNQYQVRDPIACHNPLSLAAVTVLDDVCPGTPTPMDPAKSTVTSVGSNGTDLHLGVGSIASLTPEAFMDTPMVNGTVYPTLTLDPQAYRFRVLSIGNDRTLNLSWFVACGTAGYTPSALAVPCPVPTVAGIAAGTEVGMVPASPTAGYPLWWPTDGRDGGVPDPASAGPAWYAIGNEGGVLPAPTVIPAAPVNYEYDRRSVTITNTSTISLNLMPAERADVIVDFTAFAGKTLILYNDAPAPYPAFDTRYDYYTGDPDQSGAGGAPTTLAGFGPNTRTIMQVKVNSSVAGPATSFNPTALAAYLPEVFKATQPVPIVPEPAYSAIYGNGTQFKPIMPTLGANTLTYTPIGAAGPHTFTFGQKAIQELFELDYGRMNATLGTEIQLTTYNNQTTIPLGYPDPFTDDIYDSSNVAGQPVGVTGDGTQIWEVIHNGVDSHAIHFHLYNVQIIDRVGWDGTLRAPFPNELGWKDTVRMNPLEIDFVALRPMKQTLPFPVPDSTRLLDVTRPPGKDPALTPFTPTNAASTQWNSVVTMGWEYVWHCHILGHEENDMMREQTFQVPPEAPVSVVATLGTLGGVTVTFTDMALSETGFEVQRADDTLFKLNATQVPFPTISFAAGYGTSVSYSDSSALANQTYYYRVRSFKPDADYWSRYNNVKMDNIVSPWSAIAQTGAAPVLNVTPATLLPFGSQLVGTSSTPQTVILSNPGPGPLSVGSITFAGANPADFTQTNTCGGAVLSPVTCSITVTFTPTAMGARAGNLTFTTTDPLNPQISIPLSGVGLSPALILSPVALTFGNRQVGSVSPTPLVVTVSNFTGTAPLSIGSLVLSGINAAEFTMTQTCGTTLAVGASCNASFTFAPTAAGVQSATLTVAAAAPAVSQSVAISGTGTAPVATLAPTALSFVSQLVNSTSTAQTVALTNTGLAPLSITSIAFAGANPGDFIQSATTCSLTLASGANCTIQVAFRPLARGARTGTLVVTDNNALVSTQSVSLSGTGIAPVATIIPASLVFGVQVIATTSAPQTMVLFNGGDWPLSIGTTSVGGANASEFTSASGACVPGSLLPALSSCALSVSFTPAVSGPRTGVLAIATSDPITPVLTVPLSGIGTAVSLSPAAITFASLTVGTSSTSWTVTLSNAGTSPLSISSIVLSGTNLADFTLNNQCGATVASGRSCTVRVRFAPTAIGTRSASLVFTTSDLGTPQASLALSGIGTLPALSASPSPLTFSSPVNQASAVQPVTLSNIGTAPLTITSINMGGTNTGQFNQTNNCTIGTPMAVGASCIVNVTFRPTSTNPLTKSQTLNINVAAPATSQSIPLTGAVIVPTYTVSPASITFPNQAINTTSATQTTTVKNTGTVPLPLTNVAIIGSNRFAQTSTCGASVFRPFPSTLPVGASCTISITFRPTTATTITSSLTISVGGGATPAQTQIQLTGTGK